MKKILNTFVMLLFAMIVISCNNQNDQDATGSDENKSTPKLKTEDLEYSGDTVMKGFVAFDENLEGKRPVVLIIHEWWGVTDYTRSRAKQLAELGYLTMAVDLFGGGRTADNPTDAGALAGPFYNNPQLAKSRFDVALAKIKGYPQADTTRIATIGYCFGGSMALNFARMGEDLDGAVSFHGNLVGVPPNKDLLKAKILVCHGAADPFVPQSEVDQFKKQMDSIGADYEFKAYEGAVHAFTNPNATEVGKKFNIPIKYDAAADSASWKDMRGFLDRVFGERAMRK